MINNIIYNSITKTVLVTALLMCSRLAFAQVDTLAMDSDELFKIARNEAFNGNRDKARTYLKAILVKSPDYADVRIFLGRTYSWDGNRNEARAEFEKVLAKEPENIDALSALIDVEIWDDKHEKALELSNSGLAKHPNEPDFLFRKAKALYKLQREKESASTLQSLFVVDANHKEGLELLQTLKTAGIKNSLTVNYSVDRFERVFDAAQYSYFQYGRITRRGSVFLRYNYSNRFNTNGHQYEVDLYPTIARGLYAYLNYGHSETSLFPLNRFGGELYFKLPKAFEGSGGLRYLFFRSGTKVTLYTATIGKYAGNYWFSARVFLTPDKIAPLSSSFIFQIRRYLKDAENYIGVVGSFGFSPDVTNLSQISDDSSVKANIATLRSSRIALDYRRTFGIHWLAGASVNYAKQEYLFDLGNLNTIYTWSLNLQYRF